jgi:putative transposase
MVWFIIGHLFATLLTWVRIGQPSESQKNLELLLRVVHSAGLQDPAGARLVLGPMAARFTRLRLIWADDIYKGPLGRWVWSCFGWVLQIVKRTDDAKGFQVMPHRWVVERTFAWLGRYRPLSKDYEALPKSSETWIYMALSFLMLKRLATFYSLSVHPLRAFRPLLMKLKT